MYGYGMRPSWRQQNRDGPRNSGNFFDRRSYDRRHDYQYRIREQDYGYVICRYCSEHHRNDAQKCYIMCEYCHGIHFKSDLKQKNNNFNAQVCPFMLVNTIQLQNNKAFECQQCGGHGTYEKYIVTTYRQPLTSFKRRQQDYEELKQEYGEDGLDVPKHRIYQTKESTQIQTCIECKGKGKIFRVVECCDSGCMDCKYSRIKINPKWRQIRLKGESNKQEVFPCRICNEQVDLSQKILKLNCGHAFHRNCILKQLAARKHYCFICQEKDPFLEGQDFKSYIEKCEDEKLKDLIKKYSSKIEDNLIKELTLREKALIIDQANESNKSSSWITESLPEQSVHHQDNNLMGDPLDDSLRFYVNAIRQQNQRLLLNEMPESDKSLHFISESDNPLPHQNISDENNMSFELKPNKSHESDYGSFSESSINLKGQNRSVRMSSARSQRQKSQTKSQGGRKEREEREVEQ